MRCINAKVIEHSRVCGRPDTYCAHPFQAGEVYNFGNGEIACMHLHSECDYTERANLSHSVIHRIAKVMLDRSYDGGRTWRTEDKNVIFDHALPEYKKQEILSNKMTESNAPPITDNTIFHFGYSYTGENKSGSAVRGALEPFIICSEDKGHNWTKEAARPVNLGFSHLQPGNTIIRKENDHYKPFIASTQPNAGNSGPVLSYIVLYKSENNAANWEYISDIARDPLNENAHSYCNILDLDCGHFIAVTGAWRVGYPDTRWINVCHSYDKGLNWNPPVRIQSFGISPFPLLLNDGRIMLIYTRRSPVSKRGIYGIVSDDAGKTWSDEFIIRNGDASGSDIGYPVATQLDNGEIFTAYYYMVEDGQAFGGARHIAGTIFRI